ncbi:alkane hydroxylase MAH1-like [Malania oleifera]|uniref:alkane hydroxylase MAH1-like n=1 Tax=Malania oleifera TaxID=397392 RepID=UPI0025AE47B4|nr:alkane hydroxylase MAH1-like [Malania oleifera]
MATMGYAEILLALLCFLVLRLRVPKKASPSRRSPMTNWPIVGMLPGLLHNAHHMLDFATRVLKQSGCTFEIKGPSFASMDMVITSDPANAQYISGKNFSNFPKGPQYKMIFDVLGDGIFNSDSESWKSQRRITHSLIKHFRFQQFLEKTTWRMVENGLMPVLDHVCERGIVVDMQDLFQRLTFDSICVLVLGFDPGCLSVKFPEVPFAKAFDEMEEVLFRRYIVPETFWKLQKWLQVGEEKKMSKAYETVESFITQCISLKREEFFKRSKAQKEENEEKEEEEEEEEEEEFNLLKAYMNQEQQQNLQQKTDDSFLRDTAFNLMAAGRDTISAALSWFVYLLAMNPSARDKIRDEIGANLDRDNKKCTRFSTEALGKMVYLHGALCETLRLFPPVPILQKAAAQPDVLPSGHRLDTNAKILVMLYSMGRMEEIWGEDCLEFKPERWVLEGGGIKHEPSYKFIAFNAGPRSCIGKEISFLQMKAIATVIAYNYEVELVEGHPVSISNSVILHMKHGLKVRLARRCA